MRIRPTLAALGLLACVVLGVWAPVRVLVTIVAVGVLALLLLGWTLVEGQGEAGAQLKRVQRRLKALGAVPTPAPPPTPPPTPPPAPAPPPDPFRDMSTGASDLLDGIRVDTAAAGRHVVLVLQTFEPRLLFAGIRTAVLAAAHLAAELDRSLRVVVVDRPAASDDQCLAALREVLGDEPGVEDIPGDLELWSASSADASFARDDVWVATFWTTAYALRRLVRSGRIDADRVVYLVQDFEPGFYAWGPLYAKALSTYDAGFRTLVNSTSLAAYVSAQTSATVRPEWVFAPALDEPALSRAASGWQAASDGRVRVLFYARPGKPRNMYEAGLQALRTWAAELAADGRGAVVHLAGEDIGVPVDLGPGVEIVLDGKLSYDAYYELLGKVDVGLALMLSAHPGHLALELPMAGIPTVTNAFSGYREQWVDGLLVADPEPDAIAAALVEATRIADDLREHRPRTWSVGLGTGLLDAVRALAGELRG